MDLYTIAKDLHGNRIWASDLLKRYMKQYIEELKERSKSCRLLDIIEETVYNLKKGIDI